MSTIDACELFHRCLAGHRGSDWQEFVDRYGWQVRSTVRLTALRSGFPLTAPDLDEMVQDLYCRLLAACRRRFEGHTEQELWRYMSRAAHSLVVDRQRLQSARKRRPGKTHDPHRSRVRPARPGPEEQLLGKERRKLFFERCLEIVRCDRVVVELRALGLALLEGWTSREIAHHLQGGINARQVDLLVYRLRRHLAQEGIHLPRRTCVSAPAPA